MSYTPNIPLTLDSDYASLASDLRGQLYDGATQAPVGGVISGVFFERPGAQAMYIMRPTIPNGHDGWCDIYVDGAPETVIGFFSINPAELENADVKTSLVKAKTDNLPAAPAAVSDIPTPTQINTALTTAHGAGSWATATGFATPTDVTNAQTAIAAAIAALHNLSTSDIDARLAAYDGATQADLDTAKAAVLAAIAALNNLSQSQAQAAVAAALLAYNTATSGNVTSAQTAITTAIAALNNLSQAQAQTAATAALNAYAGPTKAELDAAQAAIQADIAGIEGGGSGSSTAADIWTYPDRTLTRFGSMTGIEFTYTVTNSVSGLPISGVAVWFAIDGGGAQIVWSGHTDALGVARDAYGALPRLDPGTYYVFRSRPGYVFRNPDTEIINE